MQSSPDKYQSVKAIQVNRARIKERIQEKHRQQSQQARQGRLSGLRDTDSHGEVSSDEQPAPWPISARGSSSPTGPVPTFTSASFSPAMCVNADGTLMMQVVQDWSDIGHEFGVNIHDTEVMDCLLALEDEIRHEQLFHFYDQTNRNEWEEYYNSLTS
ncbi:putative phosphatidylcholine:ceramide cholinephosphotransferase 2 [Leptomonas pyrrhocoris]|uniref:Putative phosphatidylcholine:ceramide cholinephosphotransferase 2 n=1 Tax=Leptomonas pyrrhocoris TaxID=157538 RepID=A0A0M9GB06_LEPPY|nr:putative phosphatidylcholine:ceramide cholinephosphotransferase 2 [Leptomonas pyrrhocoris]KPA86613.1 putative phosphatidylcholine:ceramide cholinephosphotransferase 2 [Leptomonas pyrrhocoris]|eukprot:XP_015665052.1 putative phosphatidylcholine:ceramide cholinephosphotransferase 2 [Leptomonas pyrrhocoris]